jgi:hypothetical protein
MKSSKKRKSLLRVLLGGGKVSDDLDGDFSDEISLELIGPSRRVNTSDWLDERTDSCPNCQCSLKKIPSAKTKCPHCHELLYVRADPRSKSRRVVVESELEEIEDAWALDNGTWNEREEAKQDRKTKRRTLAVSLGREPSETELDLLTLRAERVEFLANRQMGDLRNTYLTEGQILQKSGDFKSAAIAFITVALLDGNGAMNAMEIYDEDKDGHTERSVRGTGFDKVEVMYLPYLAKEISKCLGKGNLSQNDLFREVSNLRLEKDFGFIFPIDAVWAKFQKQTGIGKD